MSRFGYSCADVNYSYLLPFSFLKQEEVQADTESDDDEQQIYNPLKLPMGWDGKPIPYWLYKLHGLGQVRSFPCCVMLGMMGCMHPLIASFLCYRHIFCVVLDCSTSILRHLITTDANAVNLLPAL